MSASLVKGPKPPEPHTTRVGPREVQSILGGAVIMCPACKVEYLIRQDIADLPRFERVCGWCSGVALRCLRCGASDPDPRHVCARNELAE